MAAKFHCKTCNKFVAGAHAGAFPNHQVRPVKPKEKAIPDTLLAGRLEALEAKVTRLEAMLLEALEEEEQEAPTTPALPKPISAPAPMPAPKQEQEQRRPRYLLRRKSS